MYSRRMLLLALILALPAWAAQLRQIAILDIPGRPGFQDAAFANGMLVLSHAASNTVDVFDPARRRVVAQVNDMSAPHGLAVDARRARVYVANSDGKDIAVVSSKNWKLERTIPVAVAPYSLALSQDGSRLWVANWENRSVSTIDVDANDSVRTEDIGGSPQAVVYDAERHLLLAALQDTAEVVAIDPATLKVMHRYKLTASQPTAMVLDPAARRLYVAVRYAVVTLDADSGRELGRVAAPAGVDSLWLEPASNMLYVASGGGYINLYRTGATLTPVEEVHTEVRGQVVAFDPVRKLVFMPGGREGRSKMLIMKQLPMAGVPAEGARAAAELK